MKNNYTFPAIVCWLWMVLGTWKYESFHLKEQVTLKVEDIKKWKQWSWVVVADKKTETIWLLLSSHQWLAYLLETSPWWKKYQEWSLDFESTIAHLESILRIKKFESDYPDLYKSIAQHPLWWKPWMYDEHTPEWDEILIENITSRLEYLHDNPQVLDIVIQFWYQTDQLFSSSWQDKESIYTLVSDLNEIISQTSLSDLMLFLESDHWKIFLERKVNLSWLLEAFELFIKEKA